MTEPVGRRRFLGYVLAGPVLVTAAELGLPQDTAAAQIPSPEITDLLDLTGFADVFRSQYVAFGDVCAAGHSADDERSARDADGRRKEHGSIRREEHAPRVLVR